MRVLVTGASGFIGAHVAAALGDAGAEVRALCRRPPPPFAGVAEHVGGDVRDAECVARAVAGCEAVVHVAALYSYARGDATAMEEINVGGTRTVLDAAARGPARRVVVTSSAATCGPVRGRVADEGDEPPGWELAVPYKRTKLAGERLALAAAAEGREVTVVNPTTVVGPHDDRPTPTGRMISDVVEGRIFGYVQGGGLNVVSVRDVARGHVRALERGRPGERYLLGGEDLTMAEAFRFVCRRAGRPPLLAPIPYRAALGAAYLAEGAARLRRRGPRLMLLDEVRLARVPMRFSSAKAERELGYTWRSAEAALAEATDWFTRERTRRLRVPGRPSAAPAP